MKAKVTKKITTTTKPDTMKKGGKVKKGC